MAFENWDKFVKEVTQERTEKQTDTRTAVEMEVKHGSKKDTRRI